MLFESGGIVSIVPMDTDRRAETLIRQSFVVYLGNDYNKKVKETIVTKRQNLHNYMDNCSLLLYHVCLHKSN